MVDFIYNIVNIIDNLVDKRGRLMKLFTSLDFKNEPILAIINLILYILLIIVIYQIFLRITGHSPVFESVMISILTILIINSFRYEYILGKFIGGDKEFKNNIKHSFASLRDDIKEIKEKLK